jgi:hypothetical protein
VDYVPSVAMLVSAGLAATVSGWLLLAYPALSVAETLFVAVYRRPAPRLVPLMLVGWLVKNTGWGLGVLVALAQAALGRPGLPPVERPVESTA